jgi:hypothetical protein
MVHAGFPFSDARCYTMNQPVIVSSAGSDQLYKILFFEGILFSQFRVALVPGPI